MSRDSCRILCSLFCRPEISWDWVGLSQCRAISCRSEDGLKIGLPGASQAVLTKLSEFKYEP